MIVGAGGLLAACVATEPAAPRLDHLRTVFPSADRADPVELERGCPRRCVVLQLHSTEGNVVGHVVTQRLTSRSGRFTISTHLGPDHRIRRVEVLTYAGERGRGVCSPSFIGQFVDKGPDDPLRVGTDVDAVTGATLSSRTLTEGVRHALHLLGGMPTRENRKDP